MKPPGKPGALIVSGKRLLSCLSPGVDPNLVLYGLLIVVMMMFLVVLLRESGCGECKQHDYAQRGD
jgi:hypothetical protein